MDKLYCSYAKKNVEINPKLSALNNEADEVSPVKVGYYWASCSNIDECEFNCPKNIDIFQ